MRFAFVNARPKDDRNPGCELASSGWERRMRFNALTPSAASHLTQDCIPRCRKLALASQGAGWAWCGHKPIREKIGKGRVSPCRKSWEEILAVRYYDWIAHFGRRTPDKVAVVDLASERHFTYAELDTRIARLAAHL